MEAYKKRNFVRQFRQLSAEEKDEFLSVTDKCRKIRNGELRQELLCSRTGAGDFKREYTVEIDHRVFVMMPMEIFEKLF